MSLLPESLPTVIPADHIPGPAQGHWTYNNYAAIPDDGTKYEVVDGALYDHSKKLNAYARSGIQEYWIADPIKQVVEVFFWEDARYYSAGTFAGKTFIPS